MGVLQLGKGFSVRTFEPPPEGFNPDKASDRERIVHGIPRCPVAFGALEQRMRTKLKNFRLIEPQFEPRDQSKRLPNFRPAVAPQTTNNWCGGITFPPSGDALKFVEGTWTMPAEVFPGSLTAGTINDVWYSASFWIGLDGDDGSSDVLHAGCEVDTMNVSASGGGAYVNTQFKPFWEWRPAGSFYVTNMPVTNSDELTSLICLHQGSTNQATIFLGNLTTKVGLWFQATAPARRLALGKLRRMDCRGAGDRHAGSGTGDLRSGDSIHGLQCRDSQRSIGRPVNRRHHQHGGCLKQADLTGQHRKSDRGYGFLRLCSPQRARRLNR